MSDPVTFEEWWQTWEHIYGYQPRRALALLRAGELKRYLDKKALAMARVLSDYMKDGLTFDQASEFTIAAYLPVPDDDEDDQSVTADEDAELLAFEAQMAALRDGPDSEGEDAGADAGEAQ